MNPLTLDPILQARTLRAELLKAARAVESLRNRVRTMRARLEEAERALDLSRRHLAMVAEVATRPDPSTPTPDELIT